MKSNEEKELQGEGKANDVNNEKEKSEDEQFFIKQLSNILRRNAYSLFSFIKSNKIFKWNSLGEIIKSNNKPLKKSNIKKLIIHAVTWKTTKPIGYKYFYNTLKHYKLPHFLKNKNLKKYTDSIPESNWRPPGELYINENKN